MGLQRGRGSLKQDGSSIVLKNGGAGQTELVAPASGTHVVTLPTTAGTDTLVGAATAATLTNKTLSGGTLTNTTTNSGTLSGGTISGATINADSNTISNIDNADIKAAAAIDATKLADGSVDNTEFQRLGTAGTAGAGNLVTTDGTQTLTNKTVTGAVKLPDQGTPAYSLELRAVSTPAPTANRVLDFDTGDTSRLIDLAGGDLLIQSGAFQTSGSGSIQLNATGATSVTLPTTGTLSTLAGAEVLTNKTISGATNTITNVSLTTGVTGTLPIANGGTGATTALAAFNALSPTTARGDLITEDSGGNNVALPIGSPNQVLQSSGTDPQWGYVVDANVDAAAAVARSKLASGTANHVVINSAGGAFSSEAQLATSRGGTGQNFSASTGVVKVAAGIMAAGTVGLASADVSGTLPIGNGGTGQTTANAALNALLPSQATHSGKVLTTDGSNTSWTPSATVPGTVGSVYSDGSALQSTAFAGNGNEVLGVNSGATGQEFKALSVGTTGTDFAIAHSAGAIAFNLPSAGASARGVVTTTDQTFAGRKSAGNSKVSVYRATDQTISTATSTKVQFNTELFDTNSEFDSSTNYRFTPSRTGYYLIQFHAMLQVSASGTYFNVEIKRGAGATRVAVSTVEAGGTRDLVVNVTKLLYLTATTDYLEFFVDHNHGSSRVLYGGLDFNWITITEVL